MPEVNYKVQFAQKYFNIELCQFDVLNEVDVLLLDRKGKHILYVESKNIISESEKRSALAQVILTNKKQRHILSQVGLIYKDSHTGNDCFVLVDCSDNSIMYNNDINWAAERPSSPSRDAIEHINNRLIGKTTLFVNDEIKEVYRKLLKGKTTKIDITLKNMNVVYNDWKNSITFTRPLSEYQEQLSINLFLVDMLNGTKYQETTDSGVNVDLIREGTNLNLYNLIPYIPNVMQTSIKYNGRDVVLYEIADQQAYDDFWSKYKRPPEKSEFLKILERSGTLYSEKYRKDTGGEYTPSCLVDLQNKLLNESGYNIEDYIVFDPCCGVGNLQNQFGIDYKKNCFMSTLEQTDVDICKIKGFDNVVQFDYLKSPMVQPKWNYRGLELDINDICKKENKKLMVIMNPPYHNTAGFKNDIAIEFFNKVLKTSPDVIVYYCKTEFLLRDDIKSFIDSGYSIVKHIMTNGKTTFKISDLGISLIIFDKNPERGKVLTKDHIVIDRYEVNNSTKLLDFKGTYCYNIEKPCLLDEIEKKIKENMTGPVIGQWCYLTSVLIVSNGGKEKNSKITTDNLKYCLLSKGLCCNSHSKYFERNKMVFRGSFDSISDELLSDAIMFALFYKGNLFSNKEVRNYVMPFKANELGCNPNDLYSLFSENLTIFGRETIEFDFRKWLSDFTFSEEAINLYKSALKIAQWYHHNPLITDKNYNDSFYDIKNAIMGKSDEDFVEIDKNEDTRTLYRVRTTKGTKGFGKQYIKDISSSTEDQQMFTEFFDNLNKLAEKIDQELIDSGLLLWKRENIF